MHKCIFVYPFGLMCYSWKGNIISKQNISTKSLLQLDIRAGHVFTVINPLKSPSRVRSRIFQIPKDTEDKDMQTENMLRADYIIPWSLLHCLFRFVRLWCPPVHCCRCVAHPDALLRLDKSFSAFFKVHQSDDANRETPLS